MEQSILVKCKDKFVKERALRSGLMEVSTPVTGKMTKLAVRANWHTPTEMSTKANGKMIKPTDMESTLIPTVLSRFF